MDIVVETLVDAKEMKDTNRGIGGDGTDFVLPEQCTETVGSAKTVLSWMLNDWA